MGLSWLGSTGTPFGYRLEYRFAEADPWVVLGDVPAAATGFSQAGLPPDARIHYRIQAWNNAGSSLWSETIGATLAVGFNETFSSEGDPWSIPGRIEFEDYNVTAGYWDSDSGNNGSSNYRFPDSVDIGTGGSGITIGWIRNGEWLEFTVIVGTAGLYDVNIRYASPNSGGSLVLKLDGNDLGTAVVFPNTGDWGAYQTLSYGQVYLPAGHHLLRAAVVNEGFNLDYMEFTLAEAATYASWQQAYLPGHPLSGATDNADSDAYFNEFDMLFGLDPLAGDPPQTQAGIDGGLGMLVFPLAKGLEAVSWTLNYSHDLGQGGGWTSVAPEQLHVLAEDPDRMWMRAEIPMGFEDAVFFQFEMVP
jgi:hypothetical protein